LGDLLKGEVKAWEGSWEERKLKLKLRWTAQTVAEVTVSAPGRWVGQEPAPEKWIWKEGSSLRKRLSAGGNKLEGGGGGLVGFWKVRWPRTLGIYLPGWVGRCLGTKEERVLILVPKALKPLKST